MRPPLRADDVAVDLDRLLSPECTRCDLGAASKKRALELAAEAIADRHAPLDARDVFDALLARERLSSTAVGEGVTAVAPGDRVAWIQPGSCRSVRLVPADRCVKLPEDVSTEIAGATLLRGLTAEYLLNRLLPVGPGRRVLIHAAAGGMGAILVPWAKALGGVVFATAGGPEKCAMAKAAGADHVIDYKAEDWVAAVRDLTGGAGVHCVYDSVGRDTFMGALEVLAPMGMAINYGAASGPVPPFPLQDLHPKSLIVTRPTLKTWIAKREDLDAASERLFSA